MLPDLIDRTRYVRYHVELIEDDLRVGVRHMGRTVFRYGSHMSTAVAVIPAGSASVSPAK